MEHWNLWQTEDQTTWKCPRYWYFMKIQHSALSRNPPFFIVVSLWKGNTCTICPQSVEVRNYRDTSVSKWILMYVWHLDNYYKLIREQWSIWPTITQVIDLYTIYNSLCDLTTNLMYLVTFICNKVDSWRTRCTV